MKHLFQKFESDCFPTCLAMIANISHKEAIKLVHPKRKSWSSYETTTERAFKVISSLGYKISISYSKDFTKLIKPAILDLQFPREPFGHVVVWDPDKRKVLDPYPGFQYINYIYKLYTHAVWIIS